MTIEPPVRVVGMAVCLALLCSVQARAAEPGDDPAGHAWGLTLGFPQLIAPTLELGSNRSAKFQLTASPLIAINSLTGRIVFTKTTGGVRPYAYTGVGLLNVTEGEGGGGVGTTPLLWIGGGLSFHPGRVGVFVDLGLVTGMDTSKGYESTLPSAAVGVLWSR